MISVALNLKFIFYNGYFFYYINFINKYIIKCVFTLSNYFNSIEISIYIRQRVIVLVIYSFFLLSSSVFFFFLCFQFIFLCIKDGINNYNNINIYKFILTNILLIL